MNGGVATTLLEGESDVTSNAPDEATGDDPANAPCEATGDGTAETPISGTESLLVFLDLVKYCHSRKPASPTAISTNNVFQLLDDGGGFVISRG